MNKSPESEKYANQAPFVSKNSLWFFVISNNKYVGGSGYEEITGTGLFHWRKCYYWLWTGIFIRSDSLKLKCLNDGFVSKAQLRASQDFSDGDTILTKRNSHQRCSAGIRTWLSADRSSSSTLTESSFLFDPCLIHSHVRIEKGPVQTVAITFLFLLQS